MPSGMTPSGIVILCERMAQTQSIPALVRDTNTILLNEIDPMVNLFPHHQKSADESAQSK